MKRITLIAGVFLILNPFILDARAKYHGWCQQGGATIPATNIKVQQTFPGCTVTVYQAGTTRLATLYADAAGTPKSNPFTSDSVTGYFSFYADNSLSSTAQHFDLRFSGAVIPTPFTWTDVSLSDPKDSYAGVHDVKAFGATGDGLADDTAAIQAVIDLSAAGDAIFFPRGTYKITSPLTSKKWSTRFVGVSQESKIVNVGRGASFVITGNYVTFEHLRIDGNGSAHGVGATGTYGIEFNGASYFKLFDVYLWYHGSHGVFVHGGSWVDSIINCQIAHNGGDGIHSVTPSGAEQNGNNLSIINSFSTSNAGNGLVWCAAGLNLSGSGFEQNKRSGILIDTTDGASAHGVNITGCYFEANVQGQIKFKSLTPKVITGVELSGNYIYSPLEGAASATALIVGEGTPMRTLDINIGSNHYLTMGSRLTHYIDLGNMPRDGSTIMGAGLETRVANIGLAQFIPVFGEDNVRDLGDAKHRPRTGYFATSVVTPKISNASKPVTYEGAYHLFNVLGGLRWVIDGSGNIYPNDNNGQDLGAAGNHAVRTGYFGTKVVTPTLALTTRSTSPCDAAHRGNFNYTAGGPGVKDRVQVCVKSSRDAYLWIDIAAVP